MENRPLRRTIGRSASKATEKYGDVVAVLKVIWDVAKHVNEIDNTKKDESNEKDKKE